MGVLGHLGGGIEIDGEGGQKLMSRWLSDICKLYRGILNVGDCLVSFQKILGIVRILLFWSDKWAGEFSLKERFNRLFRISVQRESVVNEMGVWENNVWKWELKWSRELRGREGGVDI